MISNKATLKRDGVQDFVSLRVTAIILALYALCVIGFFVTTESVTYDAWRAMFSNVSMKVFTIAALVSFLIHARIGLWQVLTDYVKAARLRALLQMLLDLTAFAYVVSGLLILWSL